MAVRKKMKFKNELLRIALLATAFVRVAGAQAVEVSAVEGKAVFAARCAVCHENPGENIPPVAALKQMSNERILNAMTTGPMQVQATGLQRAEREAIANFLSPKDSRDAAANAVTLEPNNCATAAGTLDLKAPQWNGWGRTIENSHYQPKPGIRAQDVSRLKVKWSFRYPLTGRANGQPTIIGDRVFITSQAGTVYSLDARTGCTYWTFTAAGPVRTTVVVAPWKQSERARDAAYFGDGRKSVYAVNAQSGAPLWKTQVEDHSAATLTGSPIVYGDTIYVPVSSFEEGTSRNDQYQCCTFRGSVVALDRFNGRLLWKTFTVDAEPKPYRKNSAGTQLLGPAGGAIWSAPTVDVKRHSLYVSTGNSYTDVPHDGSDAIIALDLSTGRVKWKKQLMKDDNFLVGCITEALINCPSPSGPDFDIGTSPILHTLPNGKQVLLIGQKSAEVHALNPDNGEILWTQKVGDGGPQGGIEWGHAADERYVYAAVSDHRKNVNVNGGKPGLSAIDIRTGKIIWQTPTPNLKCEWEGEKDRCRAQTAAVTVIPGVVFSGALDGHLRAYSTKDGSIVWDFNTAIDYTPVNASIAHGGPLNGGGAAIVNGALYVNSGYGSNKNSGNVLLVFTVDGK